MSDLPDMDEIIKEFLAESHEGLDQLELDLVALENDPNDPDLLQRVMRTLHTVKGSAGVLGFGRLETLAHGGESLLCLLRDGTLSLDTEMISAVLELVDALRAILDALEATGEEGTGDDAAVLAALARFQPAAAPAPAPAPAASATAAVPALPQRVAPPEEPQPEVREGDEEAPSLRLAERTVRIDVGLLDQLMDRVGELVLVRNQLSQLTGERDDPALEASSLRLGMITSELQQSVLKARMQPIGSLWGKLTRQIRDLALACGKQVRLTTQGHDTELDRSVLEAIADPITHLVRNGVDHGIEDPEARVARGKPTEGLLALRAFHEGGYVHVELRDDGRGIDVDRLARLARESGQLSAEALARASRRDLLQLIFQPGVSTAAKVTRVSGRGVGMDVVKTNVERIGGTVVVESERGRGTLFRLRIPLTLAIIPALIVTCGGDRYAIPQVALLELVQLDGEPARGAVEGIHGTPVYRLRNQLLPLVYLHRVLGVERHPPAEGEPDLSIAVVQSGGEPFGLVVDEIHDAEEIVVKPLSRHLHGLSTYAGATVMGDGKIALILDVTGIARHTNAVARAGEGEQARAPEEQAAAGLEAYLLLSSGGQSRFALRLSAVARLEEFAAARVERAGPRRMVQYRQGILPLLFLAELLGEGLRSAIPDADERLSVVVHESEGEAVGLVVDEVLDIVEEELTVAGPASRAGVECTAVLQGRLTEVLDLAALVRLQTPGARGLPGLPPPEDA